MSDALARWRALDLTRALSHEHDALHACDATRTAVLARQHDAPESSDCATAWYQHGRRLAELGVSAACCYHSARHGWLQVQNASISADAQHAAIASTLDGFAARARERFDEARCADAHRSWLLVAPQRAAICLDLPSDDPEWLELWAERVMRDLLRHDVRQLLVRLPEPAFFALQQAGALIDIQVSQAPTEHAAQNARNDAPQNARNDAQKPAFWRRIFR